MKFFASVVLVIGVMTTGCKSTGGLAKDIPSCVRKEISNHKDDADWMIGAVEEYEFQGRLVYAFQPDFQRITDGATTIKDASCNIICHVGGFGGPSVNQCNGDNFFKASVLRRTIWRKK